ncbi:Dyp-type peroxidase [Suillus weaverae]|nr:Dyp-type peroxidase [Suillus weaverae]
MTDLYKHLGRRAILPLVSPPVSTTRQAVVTSDFSTTRQAAATSDLPDLDNVQGDVIYIFPKKAENFIFFRINDAASFRTALQSFKPTTANDVKDNLTSIAVAKARAFETRSSVQIVDLAQYQIAFSRTGMYFLGVNEDTGDVRFDKHCMSDDKRFLGDQRDWDPIFVKPNPDPVNGSVRDDTGALHGVITIAGSSAETCTKASNDVIDLFGSSITVAGDKPVEGRGRPGDNKGREHFGFQDGISQPCLRGVVDSHEGQIQVDPGVIIMGYPGDPVRDDSTIKVKRPAWTKDGTILVFRKLEQSVILFEDYVQKNGPRWREFIPGGDISPPLNKQEAEDLFAARLIGRWKSGAPLASYPFRDNKDAAKNPELNNNFDYVVRDNPNISQYEPSDYYCPFTAHTRKTAPRNLYPYIDAKFLESGSIVRAGLPYGDEVTEQERIDVANGSPELPRGLLFNCYMSSLDSGFVRQTVGYADNDYWPMTSLVPQKKGQDPILGSPPVYTPARLEVPSPLVKAGNRVELQVTGADGALYEVSGFAKAVNKDVAPAPGADSDNPFFVTSRGGEYFFVPSVSTLKSWASATTAPSKLDIVFLLDATDGMQVYIEKVRDTIQSLAERLVATGKWSSGDLRFGPIAFRDHPPQDSTYITLQYPFDSDVLAVKVNLANLQADGGGDGPETQCDAFTHSPPHGIGEDEDGFPDGCPLQNDPVRLVNRMAKLGIILHVLACEPTMSMDFATPLDFYKGMVQKTGGRFLPLSDVDSLLDLCTGSILETADLDALVLENINEVSTQAKAQKATADDISKDLYSRLSPSTQVNTFTVDDIYAANEQGDKNVQIWLNAEQIDDSTTSQIKEATGFRLKREYRRGGTPATSLKTQPVSLNQVETVVRMCLARAA